MKVFWTMPTGLRPAYQHELSFYYQHLAKKELQKAWRHLERAHIIGQPWAIQHTGVHWIMLRFGFQIKDWREIFGQIPRLLVGGVKSFIGKIPVGNTGGSDVPPLKQMEIPDDMKELMKPYLNL